MASKHLSSSKEHKRKSEKQGAIENEGRESDDDEEQLRQHLERLAKVTGKSKSKSKRVSGKDKKEKKKQVALLLRQYLEIIENEGSTEDEDEAPAAGDEERVGSTVVVDTDGRPSPPMSKSDPKCFADAEKGGFEIGEDDDDDDDDDYEEEEEEDLSASTDEDAAASSDNGSDKLSTEELLEDVEKEAEDKLSERFLDYDKVWEYAMATPQGLLGQVKKGFMKPALIEVSNGLLLYARLSFKGGGQLHHDAGVRMTAKEVLAAGPVRARVLFGVQEGWPFHVPLKKGNKKKIYHVAADSQQEAHVWLHTILEAPKDSTKSVRGFLWVESAQTGKWSRYYCIADPTHFEWFRTKEAKTYDMKTLHAKNMKLTGSTVEGSYTETSPVSTMKSTPKVSKKALRSHHMRELKNYNHELILWTRERPVKKVFHFMTESNDRRLFWKNVFVAAAAAKDNADPSQPPPPSNTQPASAQHSSIPSPSSSQPNSRGPSRPSSRPSSAYGNGPISLSDPSYASAAASAPSLSHSEPPSASGGGGGPLTASSASTGATVTFSALPAGSNPFQPSAASAYMATRFSSLSEHMAFALKGVGEEEKKTSEKRKEKDASGGTKEDAAACGVVVTPPSSVPATPESRPRLSTLSRDASIFRSGVGLETKETTQLRNDLRDLMEQADREAGKTRFGNYSLAKSGVGDGHVRVISLDGGGLRAVMEAVILERLLEFFPDLLERTDMFAGISGGSMVAAGLVCGRSPTFIRRLLDILAPRVFNPKGRFRTGKAIQSSKFANKNLLVAGSEITKNIKLDQLRPKMLLIPSFLLDNGLNNEERSWEPLIFHNVPLKPKQLRASSLPRSNTRELEVKLQGSGNLTCVHKRSCSIDERKKKDKSASMDPSAPVAASTSSSSLLGDLKEKEAAHRKKEKKRGESFNNRTFTMRPSTTSSAAASLVSPREKVAHKRTRSSADDLTKVAGIKDRTKESLLRPDSGLTGSSKLKVRSGVSQKKEEGGESEESDASDDEDDGYDALCVDEERNVPIWDCVMGSSAAPTYFPSYKRQIDAAVMCNNPALAAISTLMSERAAQPKTPKQIHILSLGTGRLSQFIDGDQHDWGMIKWAPYLLQIMIGATSLYEQKQAKAILGPRYHRVDPFLPAPLAMDEPLLLSVLVEQAMKVDLEETIEWIEENWYSEDERKERRAKREREQQQSAAAAQTQSSDGAPLANGSSSATAAAGKLQGGGSSKLKGAAGSKDKKSRDKKKRKDKKANRKSVYAPVGQEGEECTLRGNWGDAAWFGSLGST